MRKGDDLMRPRDWKSSGNEPWVYRAKDMDDLLGVHADLMESRLRNGEQVRYLLYSPMFEEEVTPFGARGERASHAVAVANDRFLISRDTHRRRAPTRVEVIPFDAVLCVELGAALFMGWLVIRYSLGSSVAGSVVIHKSTGSEIFAEAIREYRLATIEAGPCVSNLPETSCAGHWEKMPPDVAARIGSLMLADEEPLALARASPVWAQTRRLWRTTFVNAVSETFLALTTGALFITSRERGIRPEMWDYGVNVVCINIKAVGSARLVRKTAHGSFPTGRLPNSAESARAISC